MNDNLNYDFIGIGAGPANLSLAALSSKHLEIRTTFLEKQEDFKWHPGMLLPNAKLQVSFLKDLVTLVDPTNPYSFLNYLFSKKSLYQFITADFKQITRMEFSAYLKWVFNNLNSVRKAEEVREINFDGDELKVITSKNNAYHTKNLVLGMGLVPYTPSFCQQYIGDNIFHSHEFLYRKNNFKGSKVAIIGGGQSGAEIMQSLIGSDEELPQSIFWFSKRLNFLPIDNSPFTNELFTPTYTNYFYSLSPERRKALIFEHKLASDGISEYTAQDIYRRLYEIRYVQEIDQECHLFPSHELISIKKLDAGYSITVRDIENKNFKEYIVDKVILCTGYKYEEPQFLSSISDKLHRDEHGLIVTEQYKIKWDGEDRCSIYMQNGARHTHGVADPNLSLLAFRSATILNDIMGREVYPNIEGSSLITWE